MVFEVRGLNIMTFNQMVADIKNALTECSLNRVSKNPGTMSKAERNTALSRGCGLIMLLQNPGTMSKADLETALSMNHGYALFEQRIYFVDKTFQVTQLPDYNHDDLDQLFPVEFNTLVTATRSQLSLITSLTGHALSRSHGYVLFKQRIYFIDNNLQVMPLPDCNRKNLDKLFPATFNTIVTATQSQLGSIISLTGHTLYTLDLRYNFLGHYCSIGRLGSLTGSIGEKTHTLDLGWNSLYMLSTKQLEFLCINIPRSVETLSLKGNGLGSMKDDALSKAIMYLFTTRHLDLSNNRFGFHTRFNLPKLMEAVRKKVQTLNLADNQLSSIPLLSLVDGISRLPSNVRMLNLANNNLGEIPQLDLQEFLSAIPLTVKKIDLRGNNFSEMSAKTTLTDWLKHSNIKSLLYDDEPFSRETNDEIELTLYLNSNKASESSSSMASSSSCSWFASKGYGGQLTLSPNIDLSSFVNKGP